MICNCQLNPEYSVRSNHTYGPAIPILQGGMKHCRNPSKKVPTIILPTDTSLHHNNIELYIYLLYDRIPFLHTKSSNITFLTSENCTSRSTYMIIQELHTVTNLYKAIFININVYHGYNEFNIIL